jgi:hypothetical protein
VVRDVLRGREELGVASNVEVVGILIDSDAVKGKKEERKESQRNCRRQTSLRSPGKRMQEGGDSLIDSELGGEGEVVGLNGLERARHCEL